ncbi:MAG TPA: DUF6152 family protein [Sphingobium sp.]
MKKIWLAGALAAAAMSASGDAHHAFNMYDNSVYTKLVGTVKSYTWRNPHVMIEFVAQTKSGPQDWTIECSSPNIIGRRGWTPTSIKVGDKLPFTVHPMKNGKMYALAVATTLPNGTVLKDKE